MDTIEIKQKANLITRLANRIHHKYKYDLHPGQIIRSKKAYTKTKTLSINHMKHKYKWIGDTMHTHFLS